MNTIPINEQQYEYIPKAIVHYICHIIVYLNYLQIYVCQGAYV